jgi:hypothetical protein
MSRTEPDAERRVPSTHACGADDADVGDHELGVARSRAEHAKRGTVACAELERAAGRRPIAGHVTDDEAVEALLVGSSSHGSKV